MPGGEFDGFALVDWERCACLCDVGLAGYVVAWSVTADGEDMAWLVDEDALLNGKRAEHGNGDQAHEHHGPLPERWRHRIALAPYRCGRPRADGRPCRQSVKAPGRPCSWHSERASAP
jgi:hypothetical protein